ncbi:MAG: TonB-dependent receptor [Bacteroidales bacterium]|nr:TonB-dependent receptor [Bacteroidales bacterium]
MKKLILISIILMSAQGLFSQNGVIKGQLLGSDKKPLEMAAVVVDYGGQKLYSITDQKGNYIIKPLNSGTYNLSITCLGYREKIITGILVSADKVVMMKPITMEVATEVLNGPVITGHREKLLDPEDVTRMSLVSSQLVKLPDNKNIGAAIRTMSSEVNISENNKDVIIRGSRPGESVCIIDGVKQRDFSTTIPGAAIGRLVMYTGGIPAKYGDITGGVVILETKSYFDLYNDYRADQIAKKSEKPAEQVEETPETEE